MTLVTDVTHFTTALKFPEKQSTKDTSFFPKSKNSKITRHTRHSVIVAETGSVLQQSRQPAGRMVPNGAIASMKSN